MVPKGWNALNLKNVAKKIQDGNYGADYPKADELVASGIPFLTSKVIGGNGKVNQDKFDYISEEKHQKLKKAQIRSGDILFTNRGANVGTIAITPDYLSVGNIGPQLTLIRCNEKIEKDFLFQFLRGSFFQKQVRKQDSGSAMNFFGIKDTERFKILVPPLPEQRKIAAILSTWDKAITTTEQLLANSQQQKKALMQQLLTGKKRLLDENGERFRGEWSFFSFDKAFKVANKKSAQVQSSDYRNVGEIPIVDQGKQMIAGFCNNSDRYDDVPVIIFGDHTRCLKWVDFAFCPGADGTQVLVTQKGIDKKFGFYVLCFTDIPNLGYSRHMRELKEKDFYIPLSLKEQQKIAAVLTAADNEISALQQKIEALKQEKKALMQQLLTGKRRVEVDEVAA